MTWYYARVKWAVMAEGRGLRQWKESMFLFRAVDRETALLLALQLGTEGQETEETRRGWVDKRLAGIIELDDLWDGQEIELGSKPADRIIAYEHRFEPERSEPRPAF